MIEEHNGYAFDYDSVKENWDAISTLNIGRMFVEDKDVQTIETIFNLKERTIEALRALRNAIVQCLTHEGFKVAHLTEEGDEIPGVKADYDEFFKWQWRISGITAVIDKWIFQKGGMY